MRCFKCGRPLQSNEKPYFVDGKPIGPTCYQNQQAARLKKVLKSKAIPNDQPDLFKE